MRVVLLGDRGNMGSRYKAILKYLNHDVVGFDVPMYFLRLGETLALKDINHIIVATPTKAHITAIADIAQMKEDDKELFVLCEKPIDQTKARAESLFEFCELQKIRLFSVNQYEYLPEASEFRTAIGSSYWDYYKSGNDGLALDCFQVVMLAHGKVVLKNTSPVWKCAINGIDINIRHMDGAYVKMIEDFLGPKVNVCTKAKVLKTLGRIEREKNNFNWNPGA